MVEVTVKFEDGFRDRNDADRASEIAKRIAMAADEASRRTAEMLVNEFNHRVEQAAKELRAAHLALRESEDERTMAKKDDWGAQAKEHVASALAIVTAKQHVATIGTGNIVHSTTDTPGVEVRP